MNINSHKMRLITAALCNRELDVTYLLSDVNFMNEVNEKAAVLFSKSGFRNDHRTKQQFIDSTIIGELGEHSILQCCKDCFLESVHNDETITLEKHWDILVELLKGEVKFQGEGFGDNHPKEFFSFNHPSKDELMRQKWSSYDFIVAFYLKERQGRFFVVPWMLIDNAVIDPELKLYVESKHRCPYDPGKFGFYLKTDKAQSYFRKLNKNP